MIGALVPYLRKIKRSYQSNDIIDRLNYQYTTVLLMFAAITLAATQYVGSPIRCWTPPQFTGSWEKYAETYCFAKGTYYSALDEDLDGDFVSRNARRQINYYQWVPLVLAFQAFLFYVPSLVWKSLNFQTGINVKGVLSAAAAAKKKVDGKSRTGQISLAATHLFEALDMQRELKTETVGLFAGFRKSGIFLCVLYIFTKFLYVLNAIAQFVLATKFVGMHEWMWGWNVVSALWNNEQWQETGNFPRVTMCDYAIRTLGNIHTWTIQCVLMINMFNEKIYIFMWFWLIIVGALSVLSLIYYVLSLSLQCYSRAFIAKYLRCTEVIESETDDNDRRVVGFVTRYLTPDGVFLIRLIQMNGGDLLTSQLVKALYEHYSQQSEQSDKAALEEESETLPRHI